MNYTPTLINYNTNKIIKPSEEMKLPILPSRKLSNIHFCTSCRRYNEEDYNDYLTTNNSINNTTGLYNDSYLFANNCELNFNTILNDITKIQLLDFVYENPIQKDSLFIDATNNELQMSVVLRAPWLDLVCKTHNYTELIDPVTLTVLSSNLEKLSSSTNNFKIFTQQVENYYNVPRIDDNAGAVNKIDFKYNFTKPNVSGTIFCVQPVTQDSIEIMYEGSSIIFDNSDFTINSSDSVTADQVNFDNNDDYSLDYINSCLVKFVNSNSYVMISCGVKVTNQLESSNITEELLSINITTNPVEYSIENIVTSVDSDKILTETTIRANSDNIVYQLMTPVNISFNLVSNLGKENLSVKYRLLMSMENVSPAVSSISANIRGNVFNIKHDKSSNVINMVNGEFTGLIDLFNLYTLFPTAICGLLTVDTDDPNEKINGFITKLNIKRFGNSYQMYSNFTGSISFLINNELYYNNIINLVHGLYGRFPMGITNCYTNCINVKSVLDTILHDYIQNYDIDIHDIINCSKEFTTTVNFDIGYYSIEDVINKINGTEIVCNSIEEVSERAYIGEYIYIIIRLINCKVKVSAKLNSKNYLEFAIDSLIENPGAVVEYKIESENVSWIHNCGDIEYSLYLLKLNKYNYILSETPLHPFVYISNKNNNGVNFNAITTKNTPVVYYNKTYQFLNTYDNVYFYLLLKMYEPNYFIPPNCKLIIKPNIDISSATNCIFTIKPELPDCITFDSSTGILFCDVSNNEFINFRFVVYLIIDNNRYYSPLSITYIPYKYTYSDLTVIQNRPLNNVQLIDIPGLQLFPYIYNSMQMNTVSVNVELNQDLISENIQLSNGFLYNTNSGTISGTPVDTGEYKFKITGYFNSFVNQKSLEYINATGSEAYGCILLDASVNKSFEYDKNDPLFKFEGQLDPLFSLASVAPVTKTFSAEINIYVTDIDYFFNGMSCQLFCYENTEVKVVYADTVNIDPKDIVSLRIHANNNVQRKLMNDLLFNYTDSKDLTKQNYNTVYFVPNLEEINKIQSLPLLSGINYSNYTDSLSNKQLAQYTNVLSNKARALKSYLFDYVSDSSNEFVYNINTYNYNTQKYLLPKQIVNDRYRYYYLTLPVQVHNEINGYIFSFMRNEYTPDSTGVTLTAKPVEFFENGNINYIDFLYSNKTPTTQLEQIVLYNSTKAVSSTCYFPISINNNQRSLITLPDANAQPEFMMIPTTCFNYVESSLLPIKKEKYYHWVNYIWLWISDWNNIYDAKTQRYYFAKIEIENDRINIVSPVYTPVNKQRIKSLNKIHIKLFDPEGNILDSFNSPQYNINFTLQFESVTDFLENTEQNYGQLY